MDIEWLYAVMWASDINPVLSCIRTTDPHMAFSGIMYHGGSSRKSKPGSELFFHLQPPSFPIARSISGPGGTLRGWLCICSRLLDTIWPTLLGKNMFYHQPQPSLTSIIAIMAPGLPLSQHMHCSAIPSSLHLHHNWFFIVVPCTTCYKHRAGHPEHFYDMT